MKILYAYDQQLLDGWEEITKRGQLTLWILLALKDGPKYMAEIKVFITKRTRNIVSADDQSMYRALRRYKDAELVDFTVEPGAGGGERKRYTLSESGIRVLEAYLERNIRSVFYTADNRLLIERETDESTT